MIVQQDSEEAKTQELLKKVAELERLLGQKQMEIDYQSKLIEIALKGTFRHRPKKVSADTLEYFFV